MLKFLGRGSAFFSENNSAFFTDKEDLILIDCPMSSFHRLRKIGKSLTEPYELKRIFVLVTHTHSDHIGGIAMLIHYAYYMWHIPVIVAAPSDEVAENMRYFLEVLDGCDPDGYTIVRAKPELKWVADVIPTKHSDALAGRCFGYHIRENGEDIVYTGDTNTLEPFIGYIQKGTQFYTDISVHKSPVHLFYGDACETLTDLVQKGAQVFLMHLDDEEHISELIKDTPLQIAQLTE